jgi:DivIVA domain-containing protein
VTLLLTLLIMAVLALVVAVATGRIVGGLDRPASSLPGKGLPSTPISVDDLERVRFSPALRGYRMDEVDDVLDRVTEEVRRRDEEIAELRARLRSAQQGVPDFSPLAQPERPADANTDVDESTSVFRRPQNGVRSEPISPPGGVPTPPMGRHDDVGGGR